MMADRIEREIEDILNKIDDFVPEGGRSRKPTPIRPSPLSKATTWLTRRLTTISLGQVMMYALVIVVAAFFFRFVNPAVMRWVMIGGLIVLGTAFVLSVFGGGSGRTIRQPEKRWRGQPLDLSQPSWPDRVKYWLRGRSRR
jgi:hypothetical protein